MIANQLVHTAANEGRLVLQTHDEVHHQPRIRAAIKQIAGYYEMCLATAPGEIFVNDLSHLKRLNQRIIGTVNIADCDDSLDV